MRGQQNEEKLLTVKTTKLLEVLWRGRMTRKIHMKVLGTHRIIPRNGRDVSMAMIE